MVEVEWRLPLTRFRAGSPFSSDGIELIENLRPDGPLGGKGRTVDWEGRGVVCGKPTPSRL
jgi:hypothetical protein